MFDASQWLTYFPEYMDTRRALWFVRDILDVNALRENAVALASGTGFQDFKDCEPFLSAFPSVFLALADGGLVDTVADALAEFAPSLPVLKPAPGAFRDHANVREVLASGGQRAVDHLMIGAVERPAAGLLDLAAVERQENPPAVLFGVAELDRAIGGFAAGELSVWTGRRGGGKSTLLGQLLLDAVDQGFPVCAYSGELPAWRFKQWVSLQAAGPEHLAKFWELKFQLSSWAHWAQICVRLFNASKIGPVEGNIQSWIVLPPGKQYSPENSGELPQVLKGA